MIIQISKHSNDPAVASPPTRDITAFRHEHLELNWIFKKIYFLNVINQWRCSCVWIVLVQWRSTQRIMWLVLLHCFLYLLSLYLLKTLTYIGLIWGCDGFLSRWRQGLDEVTDPALALVSVGLGCNACTLTLPHLCVLMFLLLSPARAHDRRS